MMKAMRSMAHIDNLNRLTATTSIASPRRAGARQVEVFIHHAAGVGGFGGSSYIDSLVCRERDASEAWTSAADPLDERRYVGQNWRADVSVVWNTAGSVIEWMRYTPYGEAVTHPWINADFDRSGGTPDGSDESAFLTAWNLGDASADMNRSGGTPDNADVTAFYDAWNNADAPIDGVGGYSGIRAGYAGYQWDPSGNIYHVRHRVYRTDLGRWTRRDPLGYVDGMGLYEYVRGMSVVGVDPMGLALVDGCCSGGPNHSAGPINLIRMWPNPRERLESCFECAVALAQVAAQTDFTTLRCNNCCNNYVCASCPSDQFIPPDKNPHNCSTNCLACCNNWVCIQVNLLWRSLPDCVECAWGIDDDNYEDFWPSEIANCRPDRYGEGVGCDALTLAKLSRCKSREAWNGCPSRPTLPALPIRPK